MPRRPLTSFIVGSLLSVASFTAAAETLYQWTESDGTITFSPTPPPAGSGINYKTVGGAGNATIEPVTKTPENIENLASSGSNSLARPSSSVNDNPAIEHSSLVQTTASPNPLAYAPSDRSNRVQGISAGTNATASGQGSGMVAPRGQVSNPRAANFQTSLNEGENRKVRQCSSLKKRIVSLEHIMASSNNAEAMDNTVLQISRYQHSFNRHCANVRLY